MARPWLLGGGDKHRARASPPPLAPRRVLLASVTASPEPPPPPPGTVVPPKRQPYNLLVGGNGGEVDPQGLGGGVGAWRSWGLVDGMFPANLALGRMFWPGDGRVGCAGLRAQCPRFGFFCPRVVPACTRLGGLTFLVLLDGLLWYVPAHFFVFLSVDPLSVSPFLSLCGFYPPLACFRADAVQAAPPRPALLSALSLPPWSPAQRRRYGSGAGQLAGQNEWNPTGAAALSVRLAELGARIKGVRKVPSGSVKVRVLSMSLVGGHALCGWMSRVWCLPGQHLVVSLLV